MVKLKRSQLVKCGGQMQMVIFAGEMAHFCYLFTLGNLKI